MNGISWLAEILRPSQDGLYSMGLVSYLIRQLVSQLISQSVSKLDI